MTATTTITTRVKTGHRIEVLAPDVPDGAEVQLTIAYDPEITEPAGKPPRISMLDIAASIPPGPHPFATWEEYDRALEEERNAWDR